MATNPQDEPRAAASPATSPSAPASNGAAESAQMVRNAGAVGFWTLLSRVLGLVRFRLLAHYFGASFVADAFNFAFVFPNLTRRLFGEGFASNIFVPIFSSQLARDQAEAANRTASLVLMRLFYWLSFGSVALIAIAAVIRLAVPLDESMRLHLQLFQWLLPYMVFINLAAVFMGILNALGHFSVPAFAPVLLNVAVIAVCNKWVLPMFGDKPEEQIWIVAFAVLAGGVLQLLIQIPPALSRGFKFSSADAKTDEGFVEVQNGFKAIALLVAVFQINVLLDNVIARTLVPGDGPVTYLNMGTSVYQFVWSVISLAIGTVALPALSKLWAKQQTLEFENTLRQALRLSFFFALPATVGIGLLADDVVRLLYGSGKFLANDGEPVRRTAAVALYSSLGLVFFSLNAIYARALYAMKDMRTPTVTSAWSVVINVVLNLVLVLFTPLQESGIALASAISSAWQTWALTRAIYGHLNKAPEGEKSVAERAEIRKFVMLLVGMALACAIGAIIAHRLLATTKWDGKLAILGEGFAPFFAAILVSLLPFSFVLRQYFVSKLKGKPVEKDLSAHRYGVKEELWPASLKFQFALYASAMSAAIMGFVVWATRDSLPPEGSFLPVFQRALVPVITGVVAYYISTSGMHSPDFVEVSSIWKRKAKE